MKKPYLIKIQPQYKILSLNSAKTVKTGIS